MEEANQEGCTISGIGLFCIIADVFMFLFVSNFTWILSLFGVILIIWGIVMGAKSMKENNAKDITLYNEGRKFHKDKKPSMHFDVDFEERRKMKRQKALGNIQHIEERQDFIPNVVDFEWERELEINGFRKAVFTQIAGLHVKSRKEYFDENMDIGSEVYLKEEPTNKHDPFAIKIINEDGYRLGYVPRDQNRRYGLLMEEFDIYNYIYDFDLDDYSTFASVGTFIRLKNSFIPRSKTHIPKELLYPKTNFITVDNMFYGLKIVIKGDFEHFPYYYEIANLLFINGADVDKAITDYTDYIILGNKSSTRTINAVKSKNIPIITEDEFLVEFPDFKSKHVT